MTSDRGERRAHSPGTGDAPGQRFERDAFHPGVARLDRFLNSTRLDARPGLAEDISRQLAGKPGSSPARRLSSATRARDRVAITRTLRQALAIALGAGHVRPMMRAQAAGVLVFVLVASGVSSVAGLVGVKAGVEVAGTIARDAVVERDARHARDARVDRKRAGSSAATDRSSDATTAERAKRGQPSKGKKRAAGTNRPGQPARGSKGKDKDRKDRRWTAPWVKDDDRADHPLKRKKAEKGQKRKDERLEKSSRGTKDKNGKKDGKSRSRKDDRSDKPARAKKGERGHKSERSHKSKDDRFEKSSRGTKDKHGKKDGKSRKSGRSKEGKDDLEDWSGDEPATEADRFSGD